MCRYKNLRANIFSLLYVTISFRILRIQTDMYRADSCMWRWCWWWYCCDAGAGCAGLCVRADSCAGVVMLRRVSWLARVYEDVSMLANIC